MSHPTEAPEPETPRRRKWTIPRVLGLVTLIGLLAGGTLWWLSSRGVQHRLAEMRAKGLPTTARGINAFHVVPAGVADCTLAWIAAGKSAEAAAASVAANALPIIGKDCADCEIPPPGDPWDKREAVEKFLSDNAALIESIRKAAAIGGQVRFPVDYSAGFMADLLDTQRMRGISRILQLDAQASAHRGDARRVLQDIHDQLTLSEALRGEPTVISQLVRYALNSMAVSGIEKLAPDLNWSDEELRGMQARLSAMTFEQGIQRALAGETAFILEQMNQVPLGPLRGTNQALLLDLMDESIEAFNHPWPESFQRQSAAVAKLKQKIGTSFLSKRYAMLSFYTPSLEQIRNATGRQVAKLRMATIALACYRHHRLHGTWPESLDKVDTKLLGVLRDPLIDPFTGQPFLLRQDETGWLIYSAGHNEKDDQGDERLDVPFQIGFKRP
jgi:hypothetical protein